MSQEISDLACKYASLVGKATGTLNFMMVYRNALTQDEMWEHLEKLSNELKQELDEIHD